MSAAAELTPVANIQPPRLRSVDVFRGLTVAGMLLVNNPGSWSAIYPPLEHAEWHGWTPTDLVFPFFLFIVGVSIELAGRRRSSTSSILRRGALIVLVGLALNAFPFYTWGTIADLPHPTLAQRIVYRFEHLRFAGVLQRIGIVYAIAALLARRFSGRGLAIIGTFILLLYWALMTLVPVPDSGVPGALLLDEPSRTLAAWSDRLILGSDHIWRSSKTWDPEGPLSTLPAIVTALFGIVAGRVLTRRETLEARLVSLFGGGVLLTIAGAIWGEIFPINKNLWTSSYVVFSAGLACLGVATCSWLVELRARTGPLRHFEVFGTNALLAFIGSGVMARFTDSLIRFERPDGRVSLHGLIFERLASTGIDERVASLLYALAFVLLWFLLLLPLHRRRLFLRL